MLQRALSLPKERIRHRFDSRGFTLEAIVVLVYGLAGSIGMFYFSWQIWSPIEDPPAYAEYHLTAEIIDPILFVFGVWIWYTVAAHLVANVLGGRGPIVRLFRTSAWALLPVGIWLLARSAVQIALFSAVDFPDNRNELSDYGLDAQEQIVGVMETGLEDPVYVLTLLAGILFVVWSWHYLAIAIQQGKDVPLETSRKAAAVPAGCLALYLGYTALQWQTFL